MAPEEEEEPEEEQKNPLLFELYTEKGKALKTLFDMAYWLMKADLYLIMMLDGLFYSASDSGGRLIMQFQLYGDKLGRYKAPWKLKVKDDAVIMSASSKSMQVATKASIKDTSITMYIKKADARQLQIELGSKSGSPTQNNVRVGGDTGYVPVDVPQFPEELRPSVRVSGKEFSDKWKSLLQFGKQTELTAQRSALNARAGTTDGRGTNVPFGTVVEKAPEVFKGTFDSVMLGHIAKCGTMSDQVLIYAMPNKPLKIVADVGSIGSVLFHLYSAKQQ